MRIEHLDATDSLHLKVTGVYEPRETALVHRLLKPGMTFVDVGAHIGYYTTMAAELVGPTGRVYAFEPNPATAELLRKNTMRYGDVVHIVQAAASDKNGRGKLYLSRNNSGDHRSYARPGRESVDVDVVTLDAVLEGVVVDFIKMDAQGVEYDILRGAEATLRRSPRVDGLVEFRPRSMRPGVKPRMLIEQLHRMGFVLHTFRDAKLVPIGSDPRKWRRFHKNLFIRKRGGK